jgi:hypothetical protein
MLGSVIVNVISFLVCSVPKDPRRKFAICLVSLFALIFLRTHVDPTLTITCYMLIFTCYMLIFCGHSRSAIDEYIVYHEKKHC